MQSMQRRSAILFALFALFLVVSADHSYGQVSGTGLETGLQILQGLSPEQRAAISQQLGGGVGGGAQGGLETRTTPLTEEQQNLQLQQQRELLIEQQKQRAELQRLSPFLQGEDWVVISIDVVPLPGAPPAVPGAPAGVPPGLLGALGGGGAPSSQQNILANPALALAAQGAAGQSSSSTQSQLSAASAAAAAGPSGQGVTAGGYATLPPNCSGAATCDLSLPVQPELTVEEGIRRRRLVELIRSRNPYQLSRDGQLALPGFAPIPLAGLTEQLATLRLGVEPALRDLYIRVTKLPLAKSGTSALKPFGYDLFEHPVSTFAPATNVPVPAGYIIGAGDLLQMQ